MVLTYVINNRLQIRLDKATPMEKADMRLSS